MKKVIVLGSTGTLGIQVLEVLASLKEYKVIGISGWSNKQLITKQKKKFGCIAWYRNSSVNLEEFLRGFRKIDVIVNCVGGLEGIVASWTALFHSKNLIQGNKESLFLSGHKFQEIAKSRSVKIIPLDSELTTLWYLNGSKQNLKLKIFASGGVLPTKNSYEDISINELLNHPIWNMGSKITVDSNSFINKIFEVGAASAFFKKELSDINVYIDETGNHHAGIEDNGEIVIGVYKPSMKIPIFQIFDATKKFILKESVKILEFDQPSQEKYPLWKRVEHIINSRTIKKRTIHSSSILTSRLILECITFKEMIMIMMELFSD